MARFVCKECGTVVVADDAKFCVSCGSQDLAQEARLSREQRMEAMDAELDEISLKLNDLGDEIVPLLERRKKIIAYFTGQKTAGHITIEELHEKAARFKYRRGFSKKD